MAMVQQVHATPAPNEAALLFVDRAARPTRLAGRVREAKPAAEVAQVQELCDPRHFLPRWWRAPEAPE